MKSIEMVPVNLDDVIENEGKNIIEEMQKIISLGMIDFNWKVTTYIHLT